MSATQNAAMAINWRQFFHQHLKHFTSVGGPFWFTLKDCSARANSDIRFGIENAKLFHDHVEFRGNTYLDPRVKVYFANIVEAKLKFTNGSLSAAEIVANAAGTIKYDNAPGPDR